MPQNSGEGEIHPDSDMESCIIDDRVPHSLFVAHEPLRFGGPYGIFSAKCASCFCEDIGPNVNVLLSLPGQGYLLPALQKELNNYDKIEGTGFYNIGLTSLLLCISTVVKNETEKLKCAHFFTMQIASETNGSHRGAAPNSRKRSYDTQCSEAPANSKSGRLDSDQEASRGSSSSKGPCPSPSPTS